jgi:hypothetical protein
MNDLFNAETGEVATISQAAEHVRRESEPRQTPPGSELTMALAQAVAELPVWITTDKQGQVGTQKTKYATLKAILTVVRPVLLKHGIRIRQGSNPSWTLDGGGIKGRLVPVYTDLIHSATGQVDRTIIEIPVTKLDAMAMGSAMSYGRRYSLLASLGITTDEADDDGSATRSRKMDDEHEESQELWVLREELTAIETVEKLKAWADKMDASRKADGLPDGEAVLLKQAFDARRKELLAAKAEKGKK